MYRNVDSHFANVPSIDIQRTKMSIQSDHKTSWNVGQVIPIYCDPDILPGDTVKMTHSAVIRLQTMLTPAMDNMVCDFMWFFIPNRLVDVRWKEIMLENTAGPWSPSTQYSVPTISSPSGGFNRGTLADYFGLPVGVQWSNSDKNAPMAYPFRAYALVCSEFFRDENLTYPLNVPTGNTNQTGSNGSSYINDVANGGMPFVAAKVHDYFTSGLPSAQKAANPVTFPLISGSSAPVYTGSVPIPRTLGSGTPGLIMQDAYNADVTTQHFRNFHIEPVAGDDDDWYASDNMTYADTAAIANWRPANLYAYLGSSVGSVTVNELRLAFQLQKFYERLAVGGSRYQETIASMFNVQSPDARLQRPEYLGGNRVPVVISEIVNTSSDSGSSSVPLGALGAISNTSDVNTDFVHSFTEHGILLGLAVVRVATRSYSQGIPKSWLRRTFTDYYWPVFAHLGEQPVPKVCIYANGNMNSDDVFAYQEAWAEYRYRPSITTSYMRPGISGSLASWHFGDYYTSAPTLSDGWIREPVANVDRTLAVTSAVSDQLFGDFFFDAEYTRPMPVYSVPGLIDHF